MRNSGTLEGFGSGPVAMTVLKNAIPAILAMLMVLVYNLADTFFIGQTHNAYQVAAVSLATPVFLTFMALGTVFGVGGTSVISRALGEKRMDYALKVSAFCMWSCVAVGIVVAVLFYLFMDELLLLIGASTETWELTRDYLNIVTLCGPFVLIGNCFSNILRAEGQPTRAMTGMVAGNLLNVVLDPVMILGFGWGVTGAAIATVIGNLAGAAYYILYFLRGNSNLSIGLSEFTVGEGVCRSVLGIGIPASLGSLLMSVSQIVTNSLMSGYGDMAIAGVGVAMKVTMMIGMVSIGLGQGIQPLLGYCIGAKNWERYSGILRFSLLLSLVLGVTLTGVCYLFTDAIVSAFLTQPEALEYSVQFARILLSTSFLFGIFYCLINALQAMGAAAASFLINISRQGLIYIPALFPLRQLMGANGLVWAQSVADLLSLLLAAVLYGVSFTRLKQGNAGSLGMIPAADSI